MMKGAFDSSTRANRRADALRLHNPLYLRQENPAAAKKRPRENNIYHADGVYALTTYRPTEHCCGGARLAQCQ